MFEYVTDEWKTRACVLKAVVVFGLDREDMIWEALAIFVTVSHSF